MLAGGEVGVEKVAFVKYGRGVCDWRDTREANVKSCQTLWRCACVGLTVGRSHEGIPVEYTMLVWVGTCMHICDGSTLTFSGRGRRGAGESVLNFLFYAVALKAIHLQKKIRSSTFLIHERKCKYVQTDQPLRSPSLSKTPAHI